MPNGLGRGLNSLIPNKIIKNNTSSDSSNGVLSTPISGGNGVVYLHPDLIKANPQQPRQSFHHQPLEELVESIKQHGIIQPLIVNKQNSGYELIAGERRLRAAKILNFEKVPVVIREAEEQEKLELALIENIQREDLNVVEQATAYRKLVNEFNLSQEELAKRVGKARSSVANTLRLLALPEEIKQAIIDGKLSEGHAKLLVGLDNEKKQIALYKKIIQQNLSVSSTLEATRRMGGTRAARIKVNYSSDQGKEELLREFFGTKVEVKRKGKGGQIIINFFSEEELEGIVGKTKK